MSYENDFKKKFKPPACTQQPWKHLIPSDIRDETLRKIKQETVDIYGYSMDECPKRKVCFTKACIGRELPWKSPTAKPYLDKLKATHSIVNDELYINNCDGCPIAKSCNTPCHQVNDWMNRGKEQEPQLIYQETLDNHEIESDTPTIPSLLPPTKIPWDVLTAANKSIVEKYMFEYKDFLTIAEELQLVNQEKAKYKFYVALTQLSEYAVMRKFIEDKGSELNTNTLEIITDIYVNNKTVKEIASKKNVTERAIQLLVTRLVKKHMIRWTVFVKKHGTKVIYNVPEILK